MPRTAETRMSRLQQDEAALRGDLATFNTVQEGADILVGLGYTHLRMHEFRKAAHEIWAGMHGRTTLQNLGTVGLVCGYFANTGVDEATREHFEVLHEQQS